jgi:integrase
LFAVGLENQRARANSATPEDLVFQTAKGTPLNDKNLYNRELAPACDKIGQPRISWHSFRHTHATPLHASGEPLKTAQALLGHSDLETTVNVYAHTVSDSQKRAVEQVAEVLFGAMDSVGLNSASGQLRANEKTDGMESSYGEVVVNRAGLEPATR